VQSRTQERQNPTSDSREVAAPVVPQVRTLPDTERDDRKKRLTTQSDEQPGPPAKSSSPSGTSSPKHNGAPIVVSKEHEFLANETCVICQCEFDEGDVVLFPYECCVHGIHCECFEQLLLHDVCLRCPSCRQDIDMSRSLKDNQLPPLQVHCGFNSCFGFPDGIFTMSMQYRTPEGPIRGADGAPLVDFGTVAVNMPPITEGRWYYEAVILLQEERRNLAWQPGWINTDFKITEPRSQILGLRLEADPPVVIGKIRQNSYQGVGDDHEGNSYAFDPIRNQLWYRDLPPVEGRYQRYRGVSKLLLNMTHQRDIEVIRYEDDENSTTHKGQWEHIRDSLWMNLEDFVGKAELRPQSINQGYYLYLNFKESDHIFLSLPGEVPSYRMWRKAHLFIDFEKVPGETVTVSRENERLEVKSDSDCADVTQTFSPIHWKGELEPDIKKSIMKDCLNTDEMSDENPESFPVLFSEIYDMMVRFNSEDASECEAEGCELWMRIPDDNEAFTHERVLGCCLDCEERKIEYWVDGESKAVFTDIAIGNGMMPALSFTGMLPSKLILRPDSMRFNPNGERGLPVSQWWEQNKDVWLLESRLEANPTVYLYQTELQKLQEKGEDVDHIINQFRERFGYVGYLEDAAVGHAQLHIHLPRPEVDPIELS